MKKAKHTACIMDLCKNKLAFIEDTIIGGIYIYIHLYVSSETQAQLYGSCLPLLLSLVNRP